MPFQVNCPECGYQFRVPDSVAGQRGKCPQCKAVFRAEKPASETHSAAAGPQRAKAAGENGSSAGDTKPSDTNGQGLNKVWWVVAPDGSLVKSAP